MSTTASSSGGCRLGRHDHWEATYATELANLSLTGDEGEVWFGDDVNEATADFAVRLIGRSEGGTTPTTTPARPPSSARLVDVGCGNGALVFALAARGLTHLVGLDYSAAALRLASAVADRRGLASRIVGEGDAASSQDDDAASPDVPPRPPIAWVLADPVAGGPHHPLLAPGSFDAATDKGTLDAVGLSAGGPPARRAYLEGVAALLKPGGLFVVTSCNSTLAELRAELCGEEGGGGEGGDDAASPSPAPRPRPLFAYLDHVRTYPSFRFGGVEGTKVATVGVRKL